MNDISSVLVRSTEKPALPTPTRGRWQRRAERAEHNLSSVRRETAIHAAGAGIGTAHGENALVALDTPGLIELAPRDFDRGCAGVHALVAQRREQIALLRRR